MLMLPQFSLFFHKEGNKITTDDQAEPLEDDQKRQNCFPTREEIHQTRVRTSRQSPHEHIEKQSIPHVSQPCQYVNPLAACK